MTAVVEETEVTPTVQQASSSNLAPWHFRAGALAIDILPGVAVIATMALVAMTVPFRSRWWWVCVSVAGVANLLTTVNRILLPTISESLGRSFFHITVVRRGGSAAGPWRLLARDVAHLLDTASVMVGWLWPLWDSGHRTFADMLLGTEARRVEPDQRARDTRRLIAVAVLTAALVCAAGSAVSYVAVYRHDRAVDRTRAQIVLQGPKIVETLLTYDPKSLHDDFAHALSLTTEKYRGQLLAQQQAVQKANPVVNEYWVTDSAIQTVTPTQATMLLFMQGQRGAPPTARYISATVRVAFARAADGNWLVDDLIVLTKPRQAESKK
ncbi:RDD family protein [Mycobacterium sp.]|uniref:RDD family protein n=1 Tax=Mycobacterium sp. TaxID=1785 RepID=UPI0031D6E374